jgi:hypothetical protein
MEYYEADDNEHLVWLHDILVTYAVFHQEVRPDALLPAPLFPASSIRLCLCHCLRSATCKVSRTRALCLKPCPSLVAFSVPDVDAAGRDERCPGHHSLRYGPRGGCLLVLRDLP